MSARTYIPTLVFLLTQIKNYIQRYQLLLNAHLTPSQQACLVSSLAAIVSCLQSLAE